MNFATFIAPEAAPLDAAFTRLERARPQAVSGAANALAVALSGTQRSCWPEIAWRASSLTNTGFPVELSWSSRDKAVRWTAEATGPETPEAQRLTSALSVLRTLGSDIDYVPDWLISRTGKGLRFGAWIGGRHEGNRDRYKLYIDMADTKPPPGVLPFPLAIPSRITWRMAALTSGDHGIELYGRLAKPKVWEAERLVTTGELDPEAVIDFASRLINRRCEEYLLPGTAGLSLKICDGQLLAVGFFVHSLSLLGNDATISRKVRELAHGHGWATEIYEAILGNNENEPAKPGRHGMIGFGIAADGNTWMQIGLRP